MLSKKIRLRKLNKIMVTSVLMGGCLILGAGQESGATGFRGVNSGASGSGAGRRNSTGSITGSAGVGSQGLRRVKSTGSINMDFGCLPERKVRNNRVRVDMLVGMIESDLPKKSGDLSGKPYYDALLKHDPDSIEVKDGGILLYTYTNSGTGTKVKMTVDTIDGSIIKATTDTNDVTHYNHFLEGWFQNVNKTGE